jgi:hypothetical protein
MPNQVFGEVWRARADCYSCGEVSYLHYPIKENRSIGLPTCSTCDGSLAFTCPEEGEFQTFVWGQLTNTLNFYTSTDPVVEITLGK